MMYMDVGPAPEVARASPPDNTEDSKVGRFLAKFGVIAFMGMITVVGLLTIGVLKLIAL